MRTFSLRFTALFLLVVFALPVTPAFAIVQTVPASDNAGMTWQNNELSVMAKSDKIAKKQVKKHGFFNKLKNFGKKVKFFFKAMSSGSHNAVVAILLAFFLGGLAIHRVYLGGRPLLILLYLVTIGGIFGLLPLIDFIRLIIGQMDHYEGNDDFFAAFN